MLNVILNGHEFRYEVFQIVSLFYDKSDFRFVEQEELPLLISGFQSLSRTVFCKYRDASGEHFFFSEEINQVEKKEIKNAIKRTLLRTLGELTNVRLPWGILVGIRPTKLVHELSEKGLSEEEILQRLKNYYEVMSAKAELTMEVSRNEKAYLTKSDTEIGVYVGIPFCPTRCSYCSFTSNPIGGSQKLVESYLNALHYEIGETLPALKNQGMSVSTLYFGGGTPTSISEKELYNLFDQVSRYISLAELKEFTVEAGRVDSLTEDKLRIIKEAGCSRISINPQTMNDETLHAIGRRHSAAEVEEMFWKARALGFDNINMDLIIGLPGEGLSHAIHTMSRIKALAPDNITVHTMAVKRASRLNEAEYKNGSNEIAFMYEHMMSEIRLMGLVPYYMYRQKNMVSPLENIGYCKTGREGIYNIHMIGENVSIVALGADGVTKVVIHDENRIEREGNVKDVREYINRVEEMAERKKKLFCQLARNEQ